MRSDEQGAIVRLDDELDRVATSGPTYVAAAEVELVETHRRVRSLDTTPGPNPDFVRRLQGELAQATESTIGNGDRLNPNGALQTGSAAWSPPIQLPLRRRPLLQLAAAALILLTVGGIVLGRELRDGRPDRNPVIPAAILPSPTPVPSPIASPPGEETLLDVELVADILPHGDRVLGAVTFITMGQGTSRWDAESGRCCPGVRVDFVLAGGYSVKSEGDLLVARATSGATEVAPAGDRVELSAGDAVIFPNETTIEYDNPGAGPVQLLVWILTDSSTGEYGTAPIPIEWTTNKSDLRNEVAVGEGPGRFRVRLVEIPANSKVEPVGLQWAVSPLVNGEGTPVPPMLYVRTDGQLSNDGDAPLPVYVFTLESSGPSSGTPVGTPVP